MFPSLGYRGKKVLKFTIKPHLLSLGVIFATPFPAMAGSLGTHCWQQAPFAHVICFDVNDINGHYFSLIGENMIEDASYPVNGAALFDTNNNVFRVTFTQNLGGNFVFENAVTIDPSTLNGTWTDDGGNSGDFQYLGAGPLDPNKIKALTKNRANKKINKFRE